MLRSFLRQGLLFVAIFAILSAGSSVSKSFAQSATDPGESQKPASEQSNLYPDEGIDGIGYLAISNSYLKKVAGSNMSQHEASKTVKIVFFDRPQGREVAKIERGVLSKGDKIINEDFTAPLLTYYARPSFTVLEKRSGWYRIRYMVGQGSAGIGWVKAQEPLEYRSWQEYFLDNDVILAELSNKQGNNLYDRPSSAGKRLKDITGTSSIQIQEFRGDWIKVKFQDHVFHCDDIETKPRNAKVRTGWVKWRNQGKLLIWAPAKGC